METKQNAKPDVTPIWKVLIAWAAVSIPLVWGIVQTIIKSSALFK